MHAGARGFVKGRRLQLSPHQSRLLHSARNRITLTAARGIMLLQSAQLSCPSPVAMHGFARAVSYNQAPLVI